MNDLQFAGAAIGAARPVQNRILAHLSNLRPHLLRVKISHRAILQEQHRPIEFVHFIEQGVASVCARTRRDGFVEVSMIGRFGVVGVSAALGALCSPHRCVMQMDGETLRVPASALRRAMDDSPEIRQYLLSYAHTLLVQNSQNVLCNARHKVMERLARWLLLARERLDEDCIPVTHDSLSMLLGVRRASITVALAELERAGTLQRGRGSVLITDRSALQRRSCECYDIIEAEFRVLLETGSSVHALSNAEHPR
jgi:CRP-like cAMP-binding protein